MKLSPSSRPRGNAIRVICASPLRPWPLSTALEHYSATMSPTSSRRPGILSRWTQTQTEVDSDRLESDATAHGATHIRDCLGGQPSTVIGRLRSVTLRPVAKAPAVEAELYDGTGRLTLLFLGRRRIPGITPGRHLVVHGRVIQRDGERAMVNPRYELLPNSVE